MLVSIGRIDVLRPHGKLICALFFIGVLISTALILWVSAEEQKIDDLRPRVEGCYPITENWCLRYTKFADPNDYKYYKQQYEAGK